MSDVLSLAAAPSAADIGVTCDSTAVIAVDMQPLRTGACTAEHPHMNYQPATFPRSGSLRTPVFLQAPCQDYGVSDKPFQQAPPCLQHGVRAPNFTCPFHQPNPVQVISPVATNGRVITACSPAATMAGAHDSTASPKSSHEEPKVILSCHFILALSAYIVLSASPPSPIYPSPVQPSLAVHHCQ